MFPGFRQEISTRPLLCEYGHFIGGPHRLRDLKDTSCCTAAEVNQRHSKSANLDTRRFVLDGAGRVFSDFKVLHAAITHEAFKGHDADIEDWIKVTSGRYFLALRRKCPVVTV